MAANKKLLALAAVATLFVAIVVAIMVLLARKIITFPLGLLMLVSLLGLYLGFGVLIAVYRFVAKLE